MQFNCWKNVCAICEAMCRQTVIHVNLKKKKNKNKMNLDEPVSFFDAYDLRNRQCFRFLFFFAFGLSFKLCSIFVNHLLNI